VNWDPTNFDGLVPESWHCIDCGVNTAPGCLNRAELENAAKALGKLWETDAAGVDQSIDDRSEVYMGVMPCGSKPALRRGAGVCVSVA